ncbi:MAG: hypothetical protein ACK55I_04830, partial [bacterium]
MGEQGRKLTLQGARGRQPQAEEQEGGGGGVGHHPPLLQPGIGSEPIHPKGAGVNQQKEGVLGGHKGQPLFLQT